jgi:hypothetical protein
MMDLAFWLEALATTMIPLLAMMLSYPIALAPVKALCLSMAAQLSKLATITRKQPSKTVVAYSPVNHATIRIQQPSMIY